MSHGATLCNAMNHAAGCWQEWRPRRQDRVGWMSAMSTADGLHPTVEPVEALLRMSIVVPDYQRPYKWRIEHVGQLLDDVRTFHLSGRYRIGTVILHEAQAAGDAPSRELRIVDGQQRLITFSLMRTQPGGARSRRSDRLSASDSRRRNATSPRTTRTSRTPLHRGTTANGSSSWGQVRGRRADPEKS